MWGSLLYNDNGANKDTWDHENYSFQELNCIFRQTDIFSTGGPWRYDNKVPNKTIWLLAW